MRSFILASAVLGLAAAAPAPIPQEIDFDLAYALPNPTSTVETGVTAQTVVYTASAIFDSALSQITASSTDDGNAATTAPNKVKRTACATQPTGYGPVPSDDSPTGFLSYSAYAAAATGSAAAAPSGYTQTFSNLQGSNNAYGYMGYTTLKTYDVNGCAAKCNAINGCMSINIYFERDPTLDPGSGASGCANPASTTNIKCVFWGGPVNSGNAVNTGQWQNQFQVVIAGSNGYMNNSIVSPAGYSTAVDLGTAAINAPLDSYGYNSYMGSAIFNSGPFNASLCADACSTKSAYALAHPPTDGSPVQTCQFFNTYILYINKTSNLQGQYCAMYSETWPSSYATNVGQYRGSDHFMIEYSYAYSNSSSPGLANKNGAIHQASKDISYSTLQTYCSSLFGYTTPITTVQATTTFTPITTATAYSTDATTIITPAAKLRRDDFSSVSVPASLSSIVMGAPYSVQLASAQSAAAANATSTANEKRALSTPAALTIYPSAIITSACSLQASPVSQTSTITNVVTLTANPSTTTTTLDVTATSTASPVASCTASTSGFRVKISAPGSVADGNYLQGPDNANWFVGAGYGFYSSYCPLTFSLDKYTGALVSTNSGNAISSFDIDDPALTIFQNNGADGYPPLACSISSTNQLTCGAQNPDMVAYNDEQPLTYSTFYIGSDSLGGGKGGNLPFYQLFIGTHGGDPFGVGVQAVEATLTVEY